MSSNSSKRATLTVAKNLVFLLCHSYVEVYSSVCQYTVTSSALKTMTFLYIWLAIVFPSLVQYSLFKGVLDMATIIL